MTKKHKEQLLKAAWENCAPVKNARRLRRHASDFEKQLESNVTP